jgi:hypothetical protein
MVTAASKLVRAQFKTLEATEVLTKPVNCLLGVTTAAHQALSKLGIETVFDLATSQTFATAKDIDDGANGTLSGFAHYGRIPGELIDDNVKATDLKGMPLKSIDVLRHIGPALTKILESALEVTTIRDFSLWPPYQAARVILAEAYGLGTSVDTDVEAPVDLVPANGQYPTERLQYETLLFDQFVGKKPAGVRPARPLGSDGSIDIAELLARDEGYERPAIGAVLTFTQSWYTRGLALGNLIHGVALAPGESTKIAMIDWSRRTRAGTTESIDETEQLDSDVSRSRALSEITRAVAHETQTGQSAAQNFATSSQQGTSSGTAKLSPDLLGTLAGTSPGVETSGTSSGTSTGYTNATAWSTSSGDRDIAASLSQDIVDRTQQASHSARNRRASIVREVSQAESEQISTRTLTNYNHMHALTVEYYEVVQLYRTVVELSRAERCIFVPMKLIDFRNPTLLDRYRAVLASSALTSRVNEALEYPTGTIRLKAPGIKKTNLFVAKEASPSPLSELSPDSWIAKDIRQAQITTGGVSRVLGDGRLVLPSDAVLYDIDFVSSDNTVKPERLTITKVDGTNLSSSYTEKGWDMSDKRLRISDVAAVVISASGVTGNNKIGFLSTVFAFKARSFRIVFPVKLEANVDIPAFYASIVTTDLMAHLQDNRLYYSQAIWRSLDPATIGILLSDYTWQLGKEERPLVELVDPTPVGIIANYLVLRLSADDERERIAWLNKKNIKVGTAREDLVPVPSGGVFAEAVLGRFNSAEKLDITRFWNWQDSPIPIQAPDIAAIQSGSRRDPDNLQPGTLGPPVLNIVNPPSLPDPQGMGAILAAIQNGNMFRDMSGLAATIGLAQAGLAGAQKGASDASAQAGQNAAVAAELGAKVAELAAKIVAAYFTGGASLAAGGAGGLGGLIGGGMAGMLGGISGQGAKINQGKDMDRRGVKSAMGEALKKATEEGESGDSGSDVVDSDDTGSGGDSSTDASNEAEAVDQALHGGGGGGAGLMSAMHLVNDAVLGQTAAGIAGAIGGAGLDVIQDQVKAFYAGGKVRLESGLDGAALIMRGTDPNDYYPPSSFEENTHEIRIIFDNLGNNSTEGLEGQVVISWLDNCRLMLQGKTPAEKKRLLQMRDIWFKKAIVASGFAVLGDAFKQGTVTIGMLERGIDHRVVPPRAKAGIIIGISLDPGDTARPDGSKVKPVNVRFDPIKIPLDPFDTDDDFVVREDGPGDFGIHRVRRK